MFQLIFSLCISSCTDTMLTQKYENLEACETAKVVELSKAQQDVIKSRLKNIIVKFKCVSV